MPAIPVHARIETHMNDDEVKALAKLTEYLVRGAYLGEERPKGDATSSTAVRFEQS